MIIFTPQKTFLEVESLFVYESSHTHRFAVMSRLDNPPSRLSLWVSSEEEALNLILEYAKTQNPMIFYN